MTRGQILGIVLASLQAITIAWVAEDLGWTWRLSDWEGWPVLSIAVLVAAGLSVVAWLLRLRWLAVPTSLLTLFAPWGFIYYGPILAVGLAIAGVFLRPQRCEDSPAETSPVH